MSSKGGVFLFFFFGLEGSAPQKVVFPRILEAKETVFVLSWFYFCTYKEEKEKKSPRGENEINWRIFYFILFYSEWDGEGRWEVGEASNLLGYNILLHKQEV